jgi:hypothetical protein
MITFPSLLAAELRLCLSRRAVRVLVGVALVGIVATGVVGFFATDANEVSTTSNTALARLHDLWVPGGDGTLAPALIMLMIGALIGGAVVTGGEWRAGTVGTVSTWEVRRARLLGARLLACALLAPAIALCLLALFVLAIVPVVLVKGTAGDIDAEWAVALAGAVGRGVALVSLSAVLGAAIASIGRGTAAALAALFVYNAALEPVMRAVWPERAAWLLGENLTAWFAGRPLEGSGFERSVAAGGVTLALYAGLVAAASLAVFARRDLPVAG